MSASSHFHRVLVIDDTPSIYEDFRKILAPAVEAVDPAGVDLAEALFGAAAASVPAPSFQVDGAMQGEEGLKRVLDALQAGRPYALAFVDMRMPPGWDGIETIRRLWAADENLQIVLCTAYSDHSWTGIVSQLGATDKLIILKKPFDNIEVLQLAHALTGKWALNRKLAQRMQDLDALTHRQAADLETAAQRFGAAFFGSPVAFAILSLPDGELLDANASFQRMVAGDPGQPLPAGSILNLSAWCECDLLRSALATLAAGETVNEFETRLRRSTGAEVHVHLNATAFQNGSRACALLSVKDISDRRRLESQLRQIQKVESVGALSAAITHDFNNFLTVVKCTLTLALDRPELPQDLRDDLLTVSAAADHANELTRQLLLFSRREPVVRQPLDPVKSVLGIRRILDRLIKGQIHLEWQCEPGCPTILADASNLEQMIVNLVINARDALPSGGQVTIGLRPVVVTPEQTSRHPDARAGRHILLSVADNGTGMSPEVQARVFEPFFTTKAPGQGTGLGLATVCSIMKQHEGWIELASAVGRGTTFSLYFPICAQNSASAASCAA